MTRGALVRLLLVLSVLVALPLPAMAASTAVRTPADCASALDCTADDINEMSMAQRLEFVQAMQRGPAALLGASDRWRNIEGVITFFRDQRLGAPDSWVSYVDAGIVEGIERGIAIALGRSDDDFGNPGSRKWASYVTRLHQGELTVRAEHDRAWSEAEQASTEHGAALAEAHGVPPTAAERRFYLFSEVYRWTLRNRPVVIDLLIATGGLIHPELGRLAVPFVDWFTDVRESAPSYKGCVMAYHYAHLDPVFGTIGMVDLFLAYLPELFEEFLAQRS
jgi:hypothetical protein